MKLLRSLGLSSFILVAVSVASCRLGESLDDFTSGGPAGTGGGTAGAGGSGVGGTGGTAGTGGTSGGGTGGGGGVAGTGGAGGNFVACESAPATCEDLGTDQATQLYGCCDGNVLYWCEPDAIVKSKNCATTAETCDYSALEQAMRCMGGTGGTGGSTACESGACTGPCADCDSEPTDCETDTNTSQDHCGLCGHSCQGGACTGGNCQVVVLAPNQKTPWGVAVDSTAVYWVAEGSAPDDGSVFSVPIMGGTPSELATGQNGPVQIAQDTEYLFWTNFQGGGSSVRRMRKDGSDLLSLAQASGPWALALGSTRVFWTNTSDGSLRSVVKTGGQAQILLTGEASPRGITVDTTHMYWTTSTGGEVRRANLDGTASQTLVTGQAYPLGVAVDATWVYWTEVGASYSLGDCSAADGRIVRARKADGADRQTLADQQACPMNLVVNNGTVYWTNAGTVTGSTYNYDGTIQQAKVDGTESNLVASGQDRPYGIAVDTNAVYWSNQGVFAGQGAVMKIAK